MSDAKIDELVLSKAQCYWQKVAKIIFLVTKALGLEPTDEQGKVVQNRIEALVATGRLEAQGDVSNWRHSEVRLPTGERR